MADRPDREQVREALIEGWHRCPKTAPSTLDGMTDAVMALLAGEGTAQPDPGAIDAAHLAHQREWSRETFGPGARTLGVIDHIRKELGEIESDPSDLGEWVDVIILAFDGAWRAGWEPQEIIDAVKAKQARNEARTWPDWRTLSDDVAIEHVRASGEGTAPQVPADCHPCAVGTHDECSAAFGLPCPCWDRDHGVRVVAADGAPQEGDER